MTLGEIADLQGSVKIESIEYPDLVSYFVYNFKLPGNYIDHIQRNIWGGNAEEGFHAIAYERDDATPTRLSLNNKLSVFETYMPNHISDAARKVVNSIHDLYGTSSFMARIMHSALTVQDIYESMFISGIVQNSDNTVFREVIDLLKNK